VRDRVGETGGRPAPGDGLGAVRSGGRDERRDAVSGVQRAIPTRYKEILFRSKLEADWAISLDGYGIEWEYEPEGRYFGGVYYCPDFWLPRTQQWFEVKGVPSAQDLLKWAALEKHWKREPTPEWYGFLATSLGYDLYLDFIHGTTTVDLPPLIIGRPRGMLEMPSLIADLAALPEYDEDGLPNWPDEWRDAVLLTGVGFFSYSHEDLLPEDFAGRDGLWIAYNGFPYRQGTPQMVVA
jgi:hypothetical protein